MKLLAFLLAILLGALLARWELRHQRLEDVYRRRSIGRARRRGIL